MDKRQNSHNNVKSPHSFSLKDRKIIQMTGVKEVVSYNEDKVILQTNQGALTIKGSGLNIKQLNLEDGNLSVEGHINSLEYSENVSKKGLINKLFK